jgi:hypothetical protein
MYLSPLSDRVAQLQPQAPGSLFVAPYDSQGHVGGIRPYLHMGTLYLTLLREILFYIASGRAPHKTVSNNTPYCCVFTDPLLRNGFLHCYVRVHLESVYRVVA